jgi:hypothetical protein
MSDDYFPVVIVDESIGGKAEGWCIRDLDGIVAPLRIER